MPPFSYNENITNTFKNMIGKSTNPEIEEYVKKYISEGDTKSKYSYHQINIFVKLFITQCGKYNTKIRFLDPSNNVITESLFSAISFQEIFFLSDILPISTGTWFLKPSISSARIRWCR